MWGICEYGTEIKQGDYLSSPLLPRSLSSALIEICAITIIGHRCTMTFIVGRAVFIQIYCWYIHLRCVNIYLVFWNHCGFSRGWSVEKIRHNVASFSLRGIFPSFPWVLGYGGSRNKQFWSLLPTYLLRQLAAAAGETQTLGRQDKDKKEEWSLSFFSMNGGRWAREMIFSGGCV